MSFIFYILHFTVHGAWCTFMCMCTTCILYMYVDIFYKKHDYTHHTTRTYIHTCTCTPVRTGTTVHTWHTYIHTCNIHTYIHVCMYVRLIVYILVVYINTYTYIHTGYIHVQVLRTTFMYTYLYTYLEVHTHMCINICTFVRLCTTYNIIH